MNGYPALLIVFCLVLTSCSSEIVSRQPVPTPTTAPVAAPTSPHALAITPTAPPDAVAPTAGPTPTARGMVEHTVQAGDTLLGLATQYDVPMAAIQLQNDMGDSLVVQVGQTLSIPPRNGWGDAPRFWVVHVVQAGETLVGIAQAYGLQAADIESVNGIADADLIVVGQELVLPLDAPAAPRTPIPLPTDTPIPSSPPAPTLALTHTAPLTLSSSTTSPTPTGAPVAAPPADVATWPRETVRLINEVRAQHGLSPLVYDETLALAAQAHADDCARRGWCSHTGSDGSDIKTRILRTGYEFTGWAECWAQRQTPQGAVDVWMDETPPNDPHRRTLLTTWLTEIGVGVAETTWGYYFIADFGRP